jgi:hypothetical protein
MVSRLPSNPLREIFLWKESCEVIEIGKNKKEERVSEMVKINVPIFFRTGIPP